MEMTGRTMDLAVAKKLQASIKMRFSSTQKMLHLAHHAIFQAVWQLQAWLLNLANAATHVALTDRVNVLALHQSLPKSQLSEIK